MKRFKAFMVLILGFSLFFISCPGEPYPPTEVVVAFEAVRDSALGPVNIELFNETAGVIDWDNLDGLSYTGTLTETPDGDNTDLEYIVTITAVNVYHSGYTISGAIDMTMNLTTDIGGDIVPGSFAIILDGSLSLTGGAISTVDVNNVIITNGEELGSITFDGVTYPASEFSYLPGT